MLIAGVGGLVGTCLRYLTSRLCHLLVAGVFPLGTFVVNVVGSLIIGLLYGWVERSGDISPAVSALLITGFCGGFTTFSSFADDIFLLAQGRHWMLVAVYALLSVGAGVAMVVLGRTIMRG